VDAQCDKLAVGRRKYCQLSSTDVLSACLCQAKLTPRCDDRRAVAKFSRSRVRDEVPEGKVLIFLKVFIPELYRTLIHWEVNLPQNRANSCTAYAEGYSFFSINATIPFCGSPAKNCTPVRLLISSTPVIRRKNYTPTNLAKVAVASQVNRGGGLDILRLGALCHA